MSSPRSSGPLPSERLRPWPPYTALLRKASLLQKGRRSSTALARCCRLACLVMLAFISFSHAIRPASAQIPPDPTAEKSAIVQQPNIVLIFADDLGYSDIGCYGATLWKTPNIDSIAAKGIRFTDFHVSQPVCSASRASLLTGCYANRIGIHGALFPGSKTGISDTEVTLAEMLGHVGYRSCVVGKWHLGLQPRFLPRQHGFDDYLGLPYSNDMWPHGIKPRSNYPPLPLYRGNDIIDSDVDAEDQSHLTQQYTERAVEFIRETTDAPFFLYYAHTFPHVPLYAGDQFAGRSPAGIYGDVIAEFDNAVGRVLSALRDRGIERETLVIFTSDNGPWLTYGNHAGKADPLRDGKGTVYEGGIRVPFVAQWPGKIPAGSVQSETAMTIDVFPTLANIVGGQLPEHPIDGLDIYGLLTAEPEARCPHDVFLHYYRTGELQALRSGPWKLILPHTLLTHVPGEDGTDGLPGRSAQVKILAPQLYHLGDDIGETIDLAAEQPAVLAYLMEKVERAREELGDSLTERKGTGTREAGRVDP